jgi:hypothetical protein
MTVLETSTLFPDRCKVGDHGAGQEMKGAGAFGPKESNKEK